VKSRLCNAGLSAENRGFLLTHAAWRRADLTAGGRISMRKSVKVFRKRLAAG
jgi:hypothetical protein